MTWHYNVAVMLSYNSVPDIPRLLPCFTFCKIDLTLTVLNFWKFTCYCSLKPLWSGMGEVVPAHTSPTLHPPSPPTVHQLSRLALEELTMQLHCILESHRWLKGRIVQATVCCKVSAAALVHLRPVLGGCTILLFKCIHIAIHFWGRQILHHVR